ncbi:S8 family peptidase [Actinokineospora sp.]|uniref:S8 family peptidase n=1 Tax=Actinokineospora sp. TaxID=1872133 RepID=UPI004037C796
MTDDHPPLSCKQDDLVVHVPHLDLVTSVLAGLGYGFAREPEVDQRLDLALLTLTEPAESGPKRVEDIETVLSEVRENARGRFGGWVPLIGKNRHLEHVIGFPQPQSHSARDPKPVPRGPKVNPNREAGRGVRVGILDTRLYPHPDLIGRFIADRADLRFPAPTEILHQRAGHATFVAGLVLAAAPAAELVVRAVLDDSGRATTWDTVRRMASFADSGIDILNLSLGCRTADGKPPLLIGRAVEVLNTGMLIVAAAGNHALAPNGNAPTWPAALPGVIAVGATEAGGTSTAAFSPNLPWITCTAPGTNVVGLYLTATVDVEPRPTQFTGYADWEGTSFATAIVSGAVAAAVVPGKVTAREALKRLLAEPGNAVAEFELRRPALSG